MPREEALARLQLGRHVSSKSDDSRSHLRRAVTILEELPSPGPILEETREELSRRELT
jgi:hypothetical protein